MIKIFKSILNWSEVWAVLIPLCVLLFRRRQPAYLKPVIIYLWVALFLNLAGDTIGNFKKYLPPWLYGNNPIYNFHSIVRFACFSCFFIMLKQNFFNRLKKILPIISALFIIINFTFFENFFYYYHLSGDLLTTEAYFLLIYCMLYYLARLKDDETLSSEKDFWVVTGLSIYVVVNFFVFLFYVPMITENPQLADNMWNVHNVAYIILCIFISKAFYAPAVNQY